jgi:hypothetical protein
MSIRVEVEVFNAGASPQTARFRSGSTIGLAVRCVIVGLAGDVMLH